MIKRNASLQDGNTLRLPATAEYLAEPTSSAALSALLLDPKYSALPRTVIGDGSNLLLTADLPGLVIRMAQKGIEVVAEDDTSVCLQVSAGENWDGLVAESIARGLQGLENLSLIPGSVGAAPFQNIGAYGVELADVLESLVAYHLHTAERREFSCDECRFSYRDSIFKSDEKGQWVITSVRLRLNKSSTFSQDPLSLGNFSLDYADLRARFDSLPESQRHAQSVREMVIALRQSKLPDPKVLANAGSFFKNPVIDATQHDALRQRYPDMVSYALPSGQYKLAAGWLIERAGWKGRRVGHVGMHEKQALVLVNYTGATGDEVVAFAQQVRASVNDMFAVMLEQEPVILPAL